MKKVKDETATLIILASKLSISPMVNLAYASNMVSSIDFSKKYEISSSHESDGVMTVHIDMVVYLEDYIGDCLSGQEKKDAIAQIGIRIFGHTHKCIARSHYYTYYTYAGATAKLDELLEMAKHPVWLESEMYGKGYGFCTGEEHVFAFLDSMTPGNELFLEGKAFHKNHFQVIETLERKDV